MRAHPWSWDAGHIRMKNDAMAWVRRINKLHDAGLGPPSQRESILWRQLLEGILCDGLSGKEIQEGKKWAEYMARHRGR